MNTNANPPRSRLTNKKVLIVGVSGRVGSSLAEMLVNENEVHGVARFSDPAVRKRLNKLGVKTIKMDVVKGEISKLPLDFDRVFIEIAYMHGAEENPDYAYAANAYLVGRLMTHFASVPGIVHASTGNVYGLPRQVVTESTPEAPVGVYGLSRFVGEQLIRYFSRLHKTPAVILRYFYGNDERYGVLLKLATHLLRGEEIPSSFGSLINCIAHQDLVRYTALAAHLCSTPPRVLNITSPAPYEVKEVAIRLAKLLHVKEIHFAESPERDEMTLAAYAREQVRLLGPAKVGLGTMLEKAAEAARLALH
jgi:nucleoside-diphosphate-sugar epimerase